MAMGPQVAMVERLKDMNTTMAGMIGQDAFIGLYALGPNSNAFLVVSIFFTLFSIS